MARSPEFYLQKIKDFLVGDSISVAEGSTYIDTRTQMTFICNLCAHEFKTSPQNVYHSHTRCPYCFGSKRSKRTVQEKLDSMGKSLDILSDYTGSKKHMIVKCRKCEYVWSSLFCNLKANGCPACSGRVRGSAEELNSVLKEMGKNYKVLGEYVNRRTPILTECLDCNTIWKPWPSTLISNGGCPTCAKSGFDPNKPGFLYYLRVYGDDRTYWKVGITNNSIGKRFNAVCDREKIVPLYCQYFEDGGLARECEKNILNIFKDYRAKTVKVLKLSGNTELFTRDVLQMDHLANRDLGGWPAYSFNELASFESVNIDVVVS